MNNIPINDFWKELSSFSPLHTHYEANIIVLNTYLNLIKKNIVLTTIKTKNDKLYDFLNILDDEIKFISNQYDFSNEYVNRYMLAMKMPKSSNSQMYDYDMTMQDLIVEKLDIYIKLIKSINKITKFYNLYKDFFKDELVHTNELCINTIMQIKKHMIECFKFICLEIDDENIVFEMLSLLKELY